MNKFDFLVLTTYPGNGRKITSGENLTPSTDVFLLLLSGFILLDMKKIEQKRTELIGTAVVLLNELPEDELWKAVDAITKVLAIYQKRNG